MRNRYYEELKTALFPSAVFHQFGVNGKISGSIFAAGEMIGAVAVLHGARGCGYHYRYSARTRHAPFLDIVCSNLTEQEIIFGGEDKLLQTVIGADRTYHPSLIVIIPTPVSDILQDDMTAVQRRAMEEYGIRVLCARSELFSHRDRSYSKRRMKEIAAQGMNQSKNLDFDITGCGYSEILYAAVDQLMKPCSPEPMTVNIETIAWGVSGIPVLAQIRDTLALAGVRVNCFFPSASLEEIENMPKASLNIVRRIHWAKHMREVYGTPYLQINTNGRYSGLDGIETFYRDIGAALDIPGKMNELAARLKREALDEVGGELLKLSQYRVYVASLSIQTLPYLIKELSQSYGLQIQGCAVYVSQRSRRNTDITDEVLGQLASRVEDSLNRYAKGAKLLINPELKEISEASAGVDAVFGSDDYQFEKLGLPVINLRHDSVSLSFDSYVESVKRILKKLEGRENRGSLILNKMDIDFESYPGLNRKDLTAAKDMWSKMWLETGGKC